MNDNTNENGGESMNTEDVILGTGIGAMMSMGMANAMFNLLGFECARRAIKATSLGKKRPSDPEAMLELCKHIAGQRVKEHDARFIDIGAEELGRIVSDSVDEAWRRMGGE